jgi:hypothetical protein
LTTGANEMAKIYNVYSRDSEDMTILITSDGKFDVFFDTSGFVIYKAASLFEVVECNKTVSRTEFKKLEPTFKHLVAKVD